MKTFYLSRNKIHKCKLLNFLIYIDSYHILYECLTNDIYLIFL